jgi:hypothetical protein
LIYRPGLLNNLGWRSTLSADQPGLQINLGWGVPTILRMRNTEFASQQYFRMMFGVYQSFCVYEDRNLCSHSTDFQRTEIYGRKLLGARNAVLKAEGKNIGWWFSYSSNISSDIRGIASEESVFSETGLIP